MTDAVHEAVADRREGGAPYYPVFLDVRGRAALVVGGGSVAERKVSGLVRSGARASASTPKPSTPLAHIHL